MNTLRVSTERAELNIPLIHRFLVEQSAWAKDIPLETLERAIENSLCFGGYLGASQEGDTEKTVSPEGDTEKQVAFARVISDYATFANLVDVFVVPEHRGQGHGKAILHAVMSHPDLQGLRRFTLATADAHALYAQFGFTALVRPQSLMERYCPNVYQNALRFKDH
jgi:GNAT superfamily N-acetyltransferase